MGPSSKVVFFYSGSARFAGTSSFEWAGPTVDSVHEFILLLAQDRNLPQQKLALQELQLYGFTEIEMEESRSISPESLNNPGMSAFREHYEGALADGSSLVWHP